jgi:hypothetical protein
LCVSDWKTFQHGLSRDEMVALSAQAGLRMIDGDRLKLGGSVHAIAMTA